MVMVLLAAALSVASLVYPQESAHAEQHMTAPIAIVPIRLLRKNTIGVEVGLNTLVGTGLHYSRSVTPHVNLETGFGLAFQSAKVGLRARANFLASDFTPFIAAGLMYGTGTLGALQTSDRGNLIAYHIERSPFVQGTMGLAWTTRSGFCMLVSLGWAQLLRHSNIVIRSGTPTANQLERLTFSAGSGPTGSLTMGYSF